jgi:hypothetical protein
LTESTLGARFAEYPFSEVKGDLDFDQNERQGAFTEEEEDLTEGG